MADLDGLERKAYRSTWDGGILDTLVGISLVVLGVSWFTEYAAFGGIAPILLLPFWTVLRKQIVEPRTGYVELGPARKEIERRKLGAYFLLGTMAMLLGVGVFVAFQVGAVSGDRIAGVIIRAAPGGILAVAAVFTGLSFGLHRFLGYGLLALVTALGIAILDGHPGWNFVVPGTVVLISGLSLMIRFVRRYPIQNPAA
jgi:hypothetical protein